MTNNKSPLLDEYLNKFKKENFYIKACLNHGKLSPFYHQMPLLKFTPLMFDSKGDLKSCSPTKEGNTLVLKGNRHKKTLTLDLITLNTPYRTLGDRLKLNPKVSEKVIRALDVTITLFEKLVSTIEAVEAKTEGAKLIIETAEAEAEFHRIMNLLK